MVNARFMPTTILESGAPTTESCAVVHRTQYWSEGGIREKHRTASGDVEYSLDVNYWLLLFGTLNLVSQLSLLPKHVDPARNTIVEQLQMWQETVGNVLSANPVPEPETTMKVNFDQVCPCLPLRLESRAGLWSALTALYRLRVFGCRRPCQT